MQLKSLARETFFKGILQHENQDYKVKLPIFYYDNTSMTAIYTASTAKMRARMPSGLLHPLELYPGRCLAAISAFEYRATGIGPYNEFSIAALVTHGKKGLPGLSAAAQLMLNETHVHILSLPVDSEVARHGGVELGGYPKFLADFAWSADNGFISCQVSVNGKPLVRMSGKKLATSEGRIMHTVIYTKLQNCLLNANLYVDPHEFAQSFDRSSASVDIGQGHEVCDLLKDLELSRKPLAYQFSPFSRAILFNSKNILDT